MALKDWKKIKNDKWQQGWYKIINGKQRWILVNHSDMRKEYEFVYLSRARHIITKHFKTKTQALKFAKSYMRKH